MFKWLKKIILQSLNAWECKYCGLKYDADEDDILDTTHLKGFLHDIHTTESIVLLKQTKDKLIEEELYEYAQIVEAEITRRLNQ